ncbi:hypothetical protein Rfer_0719 [Rhodoferax ferrireducens T118]|uniref:Uncharacterized protein n=1 Tax=Albidiferax ferrireducens (strain ATCC BAA-621 / DSM 15236 / T118) TaxID=338969 RepID=Q220T4_ALBFT|nr:hypothetical protein Rfer_0719 [Rhodoferax ferrireducens T118]
MIQAGDASPIFDLHFFCPALPGAFVGLTPSHHRLPIRASCRNTLSAISPGSLSYVCDSAVLTRRVAGLVRH